MGKDYYKILGVEKNATPEELKKAFRQKAHQHHPDKAGGDESKFKEINEAYQVLSDSKKRSQYDQFGSNFQQGGAGFNGGGFGGFDGVNINMDDLGDIFGGFGDIFGFGGGRQNARRRQGEDVQILLTIDFNEAVFGVDKDISFRKKIKCDRCDGSGAEPGSKVETCGVCKGTGRVTQVQRTILGNIQVQAACHHCKGEGKIITKKCSKCGGDGVYSELANLRVKIPAGIDEGEVIRLSGQGEAGEMGSAAGDLYIKIKVRSDNKFIRDGYDIKTKSQIGFFQAALGDKIEVQTVDGPVEIKIPAGTQSGTIFKLRGKGVPRLKDRGAFNKRGDQLVEVIVKTPTDLTKKQKELLKELGI